MNVNAAPGAVPGGAQPPAQNLNPQAQALAEGRKRIGNLFANGKGGAIGVTGYQLQTSVNITDHTITATGVLIYPQVQVLPNSTVPQPPIGPQPPLSPRSQTAPPIRPTPPSRPTPPMHPMPPTPPTPPSPPTPPTPPTPPQEPPPDELPPPVVTYHQEKGQKVKTTIRPECKIDPTEGRMYQSTGSYKREVQSRSSSARLYQVIKAVGHYAYRFFIWLSTLIKRFLQNKF